MIISGATVAGFIHGYGLAGLFGFVLLESLGLPVPGETMILAASVAAAHGDLNIYAVCAAAMAAAVLGDNIGYLIGRKVGRPVVLKHGAAIGITHERLAKVEKALEQRALFVVVFARFFVILRQLNGIAAGTVGMPWRLFLVANAFGAVLWVSFWATLAYRFGRTVGDIPRFWHSLSFVPLVLIFGALIIVLIAAVIFYRHRNHR